MSLVNMKQMLLEAREKQYAVPNFTVFNIEMLRASVCAAEELHSPVIVAFAEVFESLIPMEEAAPMFLETAKRASVPVAVHLDHARSFALIERALRCGFTSVMLDASDQPFEENLRLTGELVKQCREYGVSVESELGHIGGLEGYDYHGDAYTDVQEAQQFAEQTGVDALAVSIGTVHGVYKQEPKLNFERIAELRAASKAPLVMHGGSGLSDSDFKQAIQLGIAKINIHTDLTLEAVACALRADGQTGYFDLSRQMFEAMKENAKEKIRLFGAENRA